MRRGSLSVVGVACDSAAKGSITRRRPVLLVVHEAQILGRILPACAFLGPLRPPNPKACKVLLSPAKSCYGPLLPASACLGVLVPDNA
jgi:hypothetical protein